MSKQSGDKVHKTFSFDYFFAKGLEMLAIKKGISMSEIIQRDLIEKHPEISDIKTKIARRIL